MEAKLVASAVVVLLLLAAMAIYGQRTKKAERARLTERDEKLAKLTHITSSNNRRAVRGQVLELRHKT